jgi:hypothetical protein
MKRGCLKYDESFMYNLRYRLRTYVFRRLTGYLDSLMGNFDYDLR